MNSKHMCVSANAANNYNEDTGIFHTISGEGQTCKNHHFTEILWQAKEEYSSKVEYANIHSCFTSL